MPITLASNLFASKIQRASERTSRELRTVYQNLATGTDLGFPGDTGARLSVADTLRTQTRVATVALRNTNDGISYLSTMDAGMEEIQSLLTRMAELANQASNTTFTSAQVSALQLEFTALGSEIERISSKTTYNNRYTLSGGSQLSLQVGLDGTSLSTVLLPAVTTTVDALDLGLATGALSFSISGISTDETISAAQLAYSAILSAQDTLMVQRGSVTAASSRLSAAVDYLDKTKEALSTAESTIRDADMAQDTAKLIRLQVLQKANIALFAQANQIPEMVLKLLE